MSRQTEMLYCDLSAREVLERGQEAARIQATIDEVEATLMIEKEFARGQLKTLLSDQRLALQEIRSAKTRRAIEVVENLNHETSTMEVVRLDTSEVIRSRPLTEDEKQVRLFDASDPRATGASTTPLAGSGARAGEVDAES